MITEWLITRTSFPKFWRWVAKVFRHCEVHPDAVIHPSIRFGHGGHGIVIGNCFIGKNVKIMHNVTLCNNPLAESDTQQHRSPIILDDVFIGCHSIIIGGVVIGKNSVVGAGSLISHDVPSNSTVYNKRLTILK